MQQMAWDILSSGEGEWMENDFVGGDFGSSGYGVAQVQRPVGLDAREKR